MDDAGVRPQIGRSRNPVIGAGRHLIRSYGAATSAWRPDPDFLVIGAKRGGSTSFYFDLLSHDQVCPLFPRADRLPKDEATKGVHYFDVNFDRGPRWYRSYLPSSYARARLASKVGAPVVTGEASPYYLFHPLAAQRAAALVPGAKIIAVLRDPAMRSYSHWKERRRGGYEDLSFVDALAAEADRVRDAEQRLRRDPGFYSYAHEHQSYVRQSQYADGLEPWLLRFPGRVLVVSSEDYYRDRQAVLDRAADFLGLRSTPLDLGGVRNAAPGDDLDPSLRRNLAAQFASFNERLEQLTGERFAWS